MERRRAVRFQLHAPVVMEWTESSGATREEVGRTRDISIMGTFVTCSTSPPTDAMVRLEVHLPPLERNTFQQLRLRGSGQVTRTTGSDQENGFATHCAFILEETNWAEALAKRDTPDLPDRAFDPAKWLPRKIL